MIVKRSLSIRGHATSISLEERFWTRLQALAGEKRQAVAELVATIDAERTPDTNLSSALRLFVLDDALSRLADASGRPHGGGSDETGQKSSGLETPGKEL